MPLINLLKRLVRAVFTFFRCRAPAVCGETDAALLNSSGLGGQSKSCSLTTFYEDVPAADPTNSVTRRHNSAPKLNFAVCGKVNSDEFTELSAAEIRRSGPHGIEQFYPYLNIEETLKLRPQVGRLIDLESPSSVECSGFSSMSSTVSVSASKDDQFWAEDSYGVTGAERIAAALNCSDDEEFMRVRKEVLGIDRLAMPASVLDRVEERAALVAAYRLAHSEISGNAFETPKSSIQKKNAQKADFDESSGDSSSCRSRDVVAHDETLSNYGSPIHRSTPVDSTRKQFYRIVPNVDFSSSENDELSNMSKNDRRLSLMSKQLYQNHGKVVSGHLDVKKNSSLEESQEAAFDKENRDPLEETDSNMNLPSVLNIFETYFDESSDRN